MQALPAVIIVENVESVGQTALGRQCRSTCVSKGVILLVLIVTDHFPYPNKAILVSNTFGLRFG